MTSAPIRVLFLCTGNSARSVMAEALATVLGGGRFVGYSAGSQPAGTVNPLALELIAPTGYDLSRLRSKSWHEFAEPDAPAMDLVITVCDNAAGETCPWWPGRPATAHWGFTDPAAVAGSVGERRTAFRHVFEQIAARVRALAALPVETMDADTVERELRAIGAVEPLTP